MIKTRKNVKFKPKNIGRKQVELYDSSISTITNEQLYQNAGRSNLQSNTSIAEKSAKKETKAVKVKEELDKKVIQQKPKTKAKAKSKDWPPLPPTLERVLTSKQKKDLRDRMAKVKGQKNPFRKKCKPCGG